MCYAEGIQWIEQGCKCGQNISRWKVTKVDLQSTLLSYCQAHDQTVIECDYLGSSYHKLFLSIGWIFLRYKMKQGDPEKKFHTNFGISGGIGL